MTTRRQLFPLLAGAAGIAASPAAHAAKAAKTAPELRRVTYLSALTGKERDYFVYLPPGHSRGKDWPIILFLHGDGERGDAKGELDYVMTHGPLFEAWAQKRDLPFIIVSPQLPMFGLGDVDYIRNRTPAQIPRRKPDGINPLPDITVARLTEPMLGISSDDDLPDGPDGASDGWNRIEGELLAMVDRTIRDFKGSARRVYLTGLSSGGYGAWYMAARHAGRFAAVAPISGYGHPDHADPIARAKLPLWTFAGGRDPTVPLRYFFPVTNRLEALGHAEARFTIEADMGHLAWVRVYGGDDLYDWFLTKPA